MFRLLVALPLCTIALGESAQDWIAKGTRAYAEMKLDESAADFKRAVELNPHSGHARLCYGVISIFLYQNALAAASTSSIRGDQHTPTQEEFNADARRTQTTVPVVNRTLGKQAEENLRRALEIEPHNLVAQEYLAGLYFWWRDAEDGNPGETYPSRRDEAHRAYGQIVASYPGNGLANYMLGAIDTEKALTIVRKSGPYPRPLQDTQARAALAANLSPLVAEASKVLLLAIEIDPKDWFPMGYLMQMRLLQAYAAPTEAEAKELKSEADGWVRKIQSFPGMSPAAFGQSSSSGGGNTLTFDRRPGPTTVPPFPPDPKQILVLGVQAPLPPPPWPPPGDVPKQ